jgi:hypothetical protein
MAKTFNERVSSVLSGLMVSGKHDVAAVTKLAKSIGVRADNLDVDMHAAGVAALGCALDHAGNTSAVVAVINSLGKHTRAKAFAEWVEKHSNVLLTLDKKTGLWTGKIVDVAERHTNETLADLLIKAGAEPFWIVPEKSARDFSLHAALVMLLKKAETEQKKGGLSEAERLAVQDINALAEKVKPAEVKVVSPKADALETVG